MAASPPSVESATTCLPFAQASAAHISCALVYLQVELVMHFPKDTLDWLTWAKALDQLRPDLWLTPQGTVTLDGPTVARLAQYLAASPELPTLEPPLHGPDAAYVMKRLVNYTDEAQDALVELEACPKAYGPRVWNLILTLALGNATVDRMYRATCWDAQQDSEPTVGGLPIQARIRALRQARGEFDFPTGPPPAGAAPKTRPKK
jgi:hypothetical protein